jgi:hypothetical protein
MEAVTGPPGFVVPVELRDQGCSAPKKMEPLLLPAPSGTQGLERLLEPL